MAASLAENKKVLDLFHGDGYCWAGIEGVSVFGIDKKKTPDAVKGNSLKMIPALDLSRYGSIDCDVYGVPYKVLGALFLNGTLQPGTIVLFTFIFSVFGRTGDLTLSLGITKDQLDACPSLFRPYAFIAFEQFLLDNGIKKYYNINVKNKNYGMFIIPGKREVANGNDDL